MLAYSFFEDIAARRIHRGVATWPAIVNRIENVKPVASKDACGLIKLAEFGEHRSRGDSLRNNENVLSVSGLEGDYDAEEVSPEEAVRRLEKHRIRAVVYTSPSHTDEKPRWRVLAPLSRPHLPTDRPLLMARLNGALGGILEPESFTLSQSYYIGRIEGRTYKTLPCFDDPDDGMPIDQLDELDAIAAYPINNSSHASADTDGAEIAAGSRNTTLTSIGGKLRHVGLSEDELEAALGAINRGRCTPPLDDEEVRKIARSVGRYPAGPKPLPTATAPGIDRGESALALLARDMPPICYLCRPWIAEGLTLIAGRPKLGKTTLARQIAAAVAGGSQLFGTTCEQSRVLFIQLEEGERLSREKIERAQFQTEELRHVYFVHEWARGDEGASQLDGYLTAFPDVGLVIVDSLTRIRAVPDKHTAPFVADYNAVSALHQVSKRHPRCVIVVIHHTRKSKSDDPIDDISGTYGLTAACDTYWVMRHHTGGAELYVGGRLWERDESAFGLIRATQRFTLTEPFGSLTGTQEDTLRIVRECGTITPSALAKLLNIAVPSAYERLKALADLGRIRYARGAGRGAYECA